MDMLQKLRDICQGEDGGFLYDLHEEAQFNGESLFELCGCIACLCRDHPGDPAAALSMTLTYTEVLKHIIYHFDPNDRYHITNLPPDYGEKLESLESLVIRYLKAE